MSHAPLALSVPSSSYAAVGGGATPFGPSWAPALFSSDGALGACARRARRARGRAERRQKGNVHMDGPTAIGLFLNDQPPSTRFLVTPDLSDRAGKLYCRTGFHVQIHKDGKVNGTRRDNSPFGILEFLSIAFGLVSIRGKETNRYLCMSRNGKLYGSLNHTPDCIFMERMLENYYNTYTSCKYSGKRKKWFVALNKRGRPRKGNRSRKKQKYSQFLVLHLDDEQASKRRASFRTQLGLSSFALKWRRDQQQARLSKLLNAPGGRRRLDQALRAPRGRRPRTLTVS